MASLYIKDSETAAIVARVARRSGLSKTALVREMAMAREAELDRQASRDDFDRKLEEFYRLFPPTPPTGPPADKAFYDALWGETG